MGGVVSSIFGGQSESIDVPEPTPVIIDDAEKEPVSKAVRDTEQRRARARRSGYGTILTSPLGVPGATAGRGLLGNPGQK